MRAVVHFSALRIPYFTLRSFAALHLLYASLRELQIHQILAVYSLLPCDTERSYRDLIDLNRHDEYFFRCVV